MGRDEGAFHTANTSGTRAYPNRATMLDMIATMGAIAGPQAPSAWRSSVWIAPYRHPLVAAHQLATVDVLSGGRLIVGVGSGWDPQEFAAVGGDFEAAGSVTEEQIEIFKHAWSAPYVDFHGRFYEITGRVARAQAGAAAPSADRVRGDQRDRRAPGRAHVRRHLPDVPRQLRRSGRFEHLRDAVLREAKRIDRDVSAFRMYAFCSGLVVCRATIPRGLAAHDADGIARPGARRHRALRGGRYSHLTMHFDVRSGTMQEYVEILTRFAEDVLPAARTIAARPFV